MKHLDKECHTINLDKINEVEEIQVNGKEKRTTRYQNIKGPFYETSSSLVGNKENQSLKLIF